MLRADRAAAVIMASVLAAGCATTPQTPPTASVAKEVPVHRSNVQVRESLRTAAKETLQTAVGSRDPLIRMHAIEGIK
ncbi:MAG: hypothetical protein ACM359_22535, partial [Bacillota bacterium]